MKSVTWEFVTNDQNFEGPYIARYKNSFQDFFYSCKVLGIKDYDLERHFPDQNSRILGVPTFS